MEALTINLHDLLNFVFYLLPGFIAVIFFYYLLPSKRPIELYIIVFSVVMSTVINWLTQMTIYLTKVKSDIFATFLLISFSILSAAVLAKIVRSSILQRLSSKHLGVTVFPFSRVWNEFFRLPSKTVLKVTMNNGITYLGILSKASIDPNDEVQEIELWEPMYFDIKSSIYYRIKETEKVLLDRNFIISVELINEIAAKQLYRFSK